MKKRIIMLFVLVMGTHYIHAQERQETLFGEKLTISNIGVMVEPGIQVTQLSREAAGFFQFRGGLIFNDKFTFGGFFGQLLNDVRPETFANSLPDRAHLDSWTAGGFLEYTVFSNKLIHFTFPLSAGVMEVEIDHEGRDFDYDESKTLFVEPRALLEVNLHKFARLNAGVGYRVMGNIVENAAGVPTPGNAFTFQVGLKMGIFSFNQLKNN
ncbi:hypothetical protein SAMN00777080_1881 [Aquiflexum balticum DSM 16537]|uniref:Outer membrane protein beta-barrel domain-containing protein n=1 Tax=Aquiflexum balticum DSM 16537 TaxID=758820 RepID=A0A1W2H2Y3_9BACT|nr:hypothetical protein [Aquiflexum balticum]SMD43293.1 hypothetical protein SAMN00777080_1881 [Aquiflexum balticum DSM 16537]